jgi:hypothetical protein
MIIPANLSAASAMNGFKNYLIAGFHVDIPTQVIAAGDFVSATATTPLNNTASTISQVQIQYSGVQSVYNVVYGSLNNLFAASTYEVRSMYFFDTTNLNVFTVVVNQTGGNITIPDIRVNCVGFLFLAPF